VAAAPGPTPTPSPRSLLPNLTEALGPKDAARERLVILPPLYLHAAVAAARRAHPAHALGRRVGRGALVWAAHPGAAWRDLWLLSEHREIYAALRDGVGGLAQALGATVVAGTALLAHPRKHWEGWPDDPLIFHSAWALDPDGVTAGYVRDPDPPLALRRRGVRAGWPEVSPVRPPAALPPGRPRVHVAWPRGGIAQPSGPGFAVVWRPVVQGSVSGVDPVEELGGQPQGVGVYAAADARGGVTWAARIPRNGAMRRGALWAGAARPLVWEVLSLPAEGPGEEGGRAAGRRLSLRTRGEGG